MPTRYAACFNEVVRLPAPKGGWTPDQAAQAVAKSSRLDARKTKCGQDLISWANGELAAVRGEP